MDHSEPSLVSLCPHIPAALFSSDGEGTSGTETFALVCSAARTAAQCHSSKHCVPIPVLLPPQLSKHP